MFLFCVLNTYNTYKKTTVELNSHTILLQYRRSSKQKKQVPIKSKKKLKQTASKLDNFESI